MPVQVVFKKFMSVGQKSKDDPGPYGQGHNYVVHAAFQWQEDQATLRRIFARVLKEVDHRHLGLDMLDIAEPNTANLCAYIAQRLAQEGAPATFVKLVRGDGLIATDKGL